MKETAPLTPPDWAYMNSEEEALYEEKKWYFCPSKKCYFCRKDLEEISKEEEVVTGCKYCNSSFVE